MTALLVLLAWVALAVLLTLTWVAYRTVVARHSVEEFDLQLAPMSADIAKDRFRGLATTPLVPGPRTPRP